MNNIKKTIYEIMVYINLNMFEHITLDILSDTFSYSKYYLHRKFKEISGVTLNEYIKKRRIENSIYLLFADLDVNITEIADYCGFSSATFSREFKKIFNRSPKQWRNIYKKCDNFMGNSNICKNYERFICYCDNGIPKEIKSIGIEEVKQMMMFVRIFYGNYYDVKIMEVWKKIEYYNKDGKVYIGIPLNSPAVTDINSCLYLLGFESDFEIPGLSRIIIDGGKYIKVDYHGLRSELGETYTWILKYYLPRKDLKYDYRVQFQKFSKMMEFDQDEISCKLYIPIK